MLALAQAPYLENSDSKVTENLPPWSLEEMTGELESAQCATASFDILYTHKNPQADLHQWSFRERHGAENTGVSTGIIAYQSSRASQQDVFMGFHCFRKQEHTLLLEEAASF